MEVVFVHGALVRDGDWWWGPTGRLLEQRLGVRSRSVLLPSCGEAALPDGATGLGADAAALRAVLDDAGEAVVVAHSYGGTVAAEAGGHPALAHLVLISSYLPRIGESQAAVMRDEQDAVRIAPGEDGTLVLSGYDLEEFAARFLQDADPAVQAAAWARVAPQAATAFTTPTTRTAAGADTTALVCTDDRSTSLALQRLHAERATRSAELPTGHHPFVTRPDLVVEHLRPLLR